MAVDSLGKLMELVCEFEKNCENRKFKILTGCSASERHELFRGRVNGEEIESDRTKLEVIVLGRPIEK